MKLRATPGQLQALDALITYGSNTEGAHRLGISTRTFRRRIERLRIKNGMTNTQLGFQRGWDTREERLEAA